MTARRILSEMRLDALLKQLKTTPTGWAKKHGLNPTMVCRVHAEGDASGRSWAMIWHASDGKVGPQDYWDAKGKKKGKR